MLNIASSSSSRLLTRSSRLLRSSMVSNRAILGSSSFSTIRNAPLTSSVMKAAPTHSLSLPHRSISSSQSRRQEQAEEKKEMSSGEEEIHGLLTKRFNPAHLQVQDVSGGCGSFYAIIIASKDFQGLNTVKQHRLVNECLKDIIGGIHGLQLKTIPAE